MNTLHIIDLMIKKLAESNGNSFPHEVITIINSEMDKSFKLIALTHYFRIYFADHSRLREYFNNIDSIFVLLYVLKIRDKNIIKKFLTEFIPEYDVRGYITEYANYFTFTVMQQNNDGFKYKVYKNKIIRTHLRFVDQYTKIVENPLTEKIIYFSKNLIKISTMNKINNLEENSKKTYKTVAITHNLERYSIVSSSYEHNKLIGYSKVMQTHKPYELNKQFVYSRNYEVLRKSTMLIKITNNVGIYNHYYTDTTYTPAGNIKQKDLLYGSTLIATFHYSRNKIKNITFNQSITDHYAKQILTHKFKGIIRNGDRSDIGSSGTVFSNLQILDHV